MSEWVEKPWGKFRVLNSTPLLHVVEAKAGAGGRSSVHLHRKKRNIFFVSNGKLRLEIMEVMVSAYGKETKLESYILVPGVSVTVPSGLPHRFTAIEDTTFVEIDDPAKAPGVWLQEVTQEDIIRYESFEEAVERW